jgi:transposase
MKRTEKLTFKPYEFDQGMLFPERLDAFIDEKHVVRTVERLLSGVAIEKLVVHYKGGGASCYHPAMMLKVLVYAYTQRLYSSRRIAKALRENLYFMWLAAGNMPDFRTVNRFRCAMTETIQSVFQEVVLFLHKENYIRFEDYFLDGTKLESVAGKYTYVWKKSVEKNLVKLTDSVRDLFRRIDAENDAEDEIYGDRDLPERGEDSEITEEKIAEKIKELNKALEKAPEDRETRQAVKTLQENYLPRLRKCKEQLLTLGDRNSFSKTDPDATFMRMKEDVMRNGQLKPAYNIQIGTEGQFVLGYSIHQNPGDTLTLIPHCDWFSGAFNRLPGRIIADAGYGSEENYEYLLKHGVDAVVKYNTFRFEKTKKFRENPFRKENMPFDSKKDEFTCPAGKPLRFAGMETFQSQSGFQSKVREYRCKDCSGCPLKEKCFPTEGSRSVQVRPRLDELRVLARNRLDSETGITLRKRRSVEVESVFGHIKQCRGFRRFLLRGIKKVGVEWGLLMMAHNALKMAAAR